MKLYLIRHGLTKGNLERRYIGCRTDEELCEEGIARLRALRLPPVGRVVASPLKRCVQSAQILYPGVKPELVPDFRECDFGDFEGKNYTELSGDPAYQAWIDSNGELPFPGGESRKQFAERCVRAFKRLNLFAGGSDCALVAHGGTLMAIMEACAVPHGEYFDFQTGCAEGFVLEKDGSYTRVLAK
ncbi:MAG: histidine phosphatase family protein [Clostridia bacterium]|nr:histidine phosphatase family protein [Clostridia bacterium]